MPNCQYCAQIKHKDDSKIKNELKKKQNTSNMHFKIYTKYNCTNSRIDLVQISIGRKVHCMRTLATLYVESGTCSRSH